MINEEAMENYLRMSEELKLWKQKKGTQPIFPTTGKLLNKIPPPEIKKRHLRCHCGQTKATFRQGNKCTINCEGCPLGQCPIWNYTCQFLVTEDNHHEMVAVNSLDIPEPKESQEEAREWIDGNLLVNTMQCRTSNSTYQ